MWFGDVKPRKLYSRLLLLHFSRPRDRQTMEKEKTQVLSAEEWRKFIPSVCKQPVLLPAVVLVAIYQYFLNSQTIPRAEPLPSAHDAEMSHLFNQLKHLNSGNMWPVTWLISRTGTTKGEEADKYIRDQVQVAVSRRDCGWSSFSPWWDVSSWPFTMFLKRNTCLLGVLLFSLTVWIKSTSAGSSFLSPSHKPQVRTQRLETSSSCLRSQVLVASEGHSWLCTRSTSSVSIFPHADTVESR